MFGTQTCFVAVWSFQLWLCAGAEGLLEEPLEDPPEVLEPLPLEPEFPALEPLLLLALPLSLVLPLSPEGVVASGLLSTSTSLSASVASCFVSSEAFGLLATFPSSLSRMSLPASPFRVSSPFSTASFVWSTMPLSISSVTLSAGMRVISQVTLSVSVASASTVTVCASPVSNSS